MVVSIRSSIIVIKNIQDMLVDCAERHCMRSNATQNISIWIKRERERERERAGGKTSAKMMNKCCYQYRSRRQSKVDNITINSTHIIYDGMYGKKSHEFIL